MAGTESPFIEIFNWASESSPPGSIHHDQTAIDLGYPGGLIPGDVPLVLSSRAVVDRFGPPWFERGWMRHTFVRPTYNNERVRMIVEDGDRRDGDTDVAVWRLERDDGAVVGAGSAGLYAADGAPVPPWARADAPPPRDPGDYDPLPDEPVGTVYETANPVRLPVTHRPAGMRGNDDNPWYQESSPWGDPIVSTAGPFELAHTIRPVAMDKTSAREMRSGMNACYELLWTGPMLYDRDYLREAHLVAKGTKGRYAFRSIEFTLTDPATTAVVLTARWRISWITTRPRA